MKVKNVIASFIGAAVLVGSPLTIAQTCTEDGNHSSPTANYSFLEGDERVVIDNGYRRKATRWMRCALGQEWDGKSCKGEPTLYTWMEVHQLAAKYNEEKFAGLSNWRVPFLPELMTLREVKCSDPAINTEVFAGAPSVFFWTSMPAVDDLTKRQFSRDEAYGADFVSGNFVRAKVTARGAVRLIHDGPDGAAWANPFAAGNGDQTQQAAQ